jgi:hypothetical protein
MHEMPDRFDERDLDAMLDGREPSGLDNRWIRQASAESRPPKLASDVLANELTMCRAPGAAQTKKPRWSPLRHMAGPRPGAETR